MLINSKGVSKQNLKDYRQNLGYIQTFSLFTLRILFQIMNSISSYRELVDQYDHLMTTLDERAQCLHLQLALAQEQQQMANLIDQMLAVQAQTKKNRSNVLLEKQSSLMFEHQNRNNIERYEQRAKTLRDLLLSKEQELWFQCSDGNPIKNSRLYRENLQNFDYQQEENQKLMNLFFSKSQLQKEIGQLQLQVYGQHIPQNMDNQKEQEELDMKATNALLQQEQRHQKLLQNFKKLEWQYSLEIENWKQHRERYQQLCLVVSEARDIKSERGEGSAKTVSETSDDESV